MLLTHPKDVTVRANEWAQFNCTVRCSYLVRWYMAGYSNAIRRNSTVPGLEIRIPPASMCILDRKMHFFEVHASSALNASVFCCAANVRPQQRSMCRCVGGRCYSRPALLTGRNGMMHFCFYSFESFSVSFGKQWK